MLPKNPRAIYSPVWLSGFHLVKRISKYFAKEMAEHKVLVTKSYSTN